MRSVCPPRSYGSAVKEPSEDGRGALSSQSRDASYWIWIPCNRGLRRDRSDDGVPNWRAKVITTGRCADRTSGGLVKFRRRYV